MFQTGKEAEKKFQVSKIKKYIFTTGEMRKSNFNFQKVFSWVIGNTKKEIYLQKCRLNGNLGWNDFFPFENYDIRGYSIQSWWFISIVHACVSWKVKNYMHRNIKYKKYIFLLLEVFNVTFNGHFKSAIFLKLFRWWIVVINIYSSRCLGCWPSYYNDCGWEDNWFVENRANYCESSICSYY